MALLGLSKKTDYGLVMLSILAKKDGDVVSAAEMVREKKLPKAFVSQIAKDLVKAGILGSKEGKGGGYYLKREPKAVTMRDVFVAMEGKVAPVSCMLHRDCACSGVCEQREFMSNLAKEMEAVLAQHTLVDVFATEMIRA